MEEKFLTKESNPNTLLDRAIFFIHLHSMLFYSLSIFLLPPIVAFLERYHFWLFLIVGEHIPDTLNSWGWVTVTYIKWLGIGFFLSIPYRLFVLTIYLGDYWKNLSPPRKRHYMLVHSSTREEMDKGHVNIFHNSS